MRCLWQWLRSCESTSSSRSGGGPSSSESESKIVLGSDAALIAYRSARISQRTLKTKVWKPAVCIVKGHRDRPYPELQVQKIERSERTYGDFTLTFAIPQEYERKWHSMNLHNGVLRLVFTPDADEDGIALADALAMRSR